MLRFGCIHTGDGCIQGKNVLLLENRNDNLGNVEAPGESWIELVLNDPTGPEHLRVGDGCIG